MIDLLQSSWSLLEASTNRFPNDNMLAEKICRLHKHTLRACGAKVYAPMLDALMKDRPTGVLLGLAALAAILVPLLSLGLPAESSLALSDYTVALLGKFLCFAILALALDLIWGYCGILSLGHAMGMYLMRQIGDRGVYGNPELPDFMVFLNWQELPWYWSGFSSFPFALVMALAVPGLLAFLFGWLAFRSRVTGVYFSIISQALTYALMLAFFRNELGFGGNNGLTDFKDLLGYDGRRIRADLSAEPVCGAVEIRPARRGAPRCRVPRPLRWL